MTTPTTPATTPAYITLQIEHFGDSLEIIVPKRPYPLGGSEIAGLVTIGLAIFGTAAVLFSVGDVTFALVGFLSGCFFLFFTHLLRNRQHRAVRLRAVAEAIFVGRRRYERSDIVNLRAEYEDGKVEMYWDHHHQAVRRPRRIPAAPRWQVMFDHFDNTVTVAQGLSEPDARRLLGLLGREPKPLPVGLETFT